MHDLGAQMLSLFVLFHLYQLGYSLPVIAGYFLAFILLRPACQYLGTAGVLKFSIQKVIIVSSILKIGFTVALFSLGAPSIFGYGLLALTVMLDAASFWIYYLVWDIYFTDLQDERRSGRLISLAWIVTAAASFLAPLAGGLLAQFFGFKLSLAAAAVLLLLSVTPLLLIKRQQLVFSDLRLGEIMSPGKTRQLFKRIPKRGLMACMISFLIPNIILPLWLLYLAAAVFVDEAYGGLGIIAAVSSVLAIAISLLTGRLIDKGRYRGILHAGTWSEMLFGGLRFFVTGVPSAAAHNLLWQQSSHNIVAYEWYFEQAREKADRLAFFQMYSYCQTVVHGLLLALLIVSLLIFSAHQLEVLQIACIVTACFAPLILGLRIKQG